MIFTQPSSETVKMVSVKTERQPFPIRKVLFIVGEIVLALLVAYAVYRFQGAIIDYVFVLVPAVLLFSWWSIGALVFPNTIVLARTLVICGILIAPFANNIPLSELGLIAVILFITLFTGAFKAKSQADNSIRFSLLGSFTGSRGAVLFCLSLIIALLMAAPFLSYGNARFSGKMIDWVFAPTQTILEKFYPGFSFEMTINDLFGLLMKQQTGGGDQPGGLDISGFIPLGLDLGSLTQGLDSYSDQLFKKIENEARAGFLEKISSIAGFTVKGSEKVNDVFVKYFEDRYEKYSQATRIWIGRGIFIVLLLGVSGIMHMFGFILSFAELVMFGLLRSVRLLRIGRVSVEKEILSLD